MIFIGLKNTRRSLIRPWLIGRQCTSFHIRISCRVRTPLFLSLKSLGSWEKLSLSLSLAFLCFPRTSIQLSWCLSVYLLSLAIVYLFCFSHHRMYMKRNPEDSRFFVTSTGSSDFYGICRPRGSEYERHRLKQLRPVLLLSQLGVFFLYNSFAFFCLCFFFRPRYPGRLWP